MKKTQIILIFLLIQVFLGAAERNSGGPILPEQAAYDVKFYGLDLSIDPSEKFISGSTVVSVEVLSPLNLFVLNLDSLFTVKEFYINNKEVNFIHSKGLLRAELENVDFKIGEELTAKIYYSGHPFEAQNPPWDDGFVWDTTKSGKPWIGVACQGGGADIWFPCKDHPSDEPDSASLKFTVPNGLFCASNGVLVDSVDNGNNTTTYEWFVSTPINNYDITLNIAPYKKIHYEYTSTAGDTCPVDFYVLPEHYDTAKVFTPQFLDHLKFYEKYCGPYPFRADKFGLAESPYLGMEHQTIIAYGNDYQNNEFGFDWLFHHELSHEWWGNLVTAKDWSDFWIHEGIGTYMQALYAEELDGSQGLQDYMNKMKRFANTEPIKQRGSKTSTESYVPDIYNKGAWMIHTLRYYLGDDMFFKIMRRWAYPTPELEKVTDGSQCRFLTSKELVKQTEKLAGQDLSWFFNTYLYSKDVPKLQEDLIKGETENKLILEWKNTADSTFIMPVEVQIGDKIMKVDMSKGKEEITFDAGITPVVDPNDWLLMTEELNTHSKKGF